MAENKSNLTRRLVKTGDPDADAANLPVLLSLLSGLADATTVTCLVTLIRSDHPIQPAIRDMLANALAGDCDTLRLDLARKKRGPKPKRPALAPVFRKTGNLVKVGKFIADYPGTADTVESGIEAAMTEFNIVRSEAYAAWKAWRDLEDFARNS